MRKKLEILLITILLISGTATAFIYTAKSATITTTNGLGNTYYVSKNGNDNNAGTLTSPWKTLQKATNTVNAGDTVFVRSGTYNEKMLITSSGTSNNWITFKNYQNEQPIIDGTGIKPTYWAGGIIQISDASYIIVDGFKVQDSTASGICVLRSSYVTVQNCQTYNTYFSGIRACFGEGIKPQKYCTYVKILNNTISLANNPKVGQEALTFSGVHNSIIRSNILTSTCTKEGIDCKWDCVNITIAYNNIDTPGTNIYVGCAPNDKASDFFIYGNRCHGSSNGIAISLEKCGTAKNFYFYNNIIESGGHGFQFNYDNPISTCTEGPHNIYFLNNVFNVGNACLRLNPPVAGDYGRNVIIKNNIFKGSEGITINSNQPIREVTINHNFFATKSKYYGTDYLTGDPKWVNPSDGDYRLQPNSPAIGFGIDTDNLSINFNSNPIPKSSTVDIKPDDYKPSETTTTDYINNPPNKPTIKGRINGIPNKYYEYKLVSTDPDGDALIYCINWGDGTDEVKIGPYPSGEENSFIHKWSENGNYKINVKTIDVNMNESNWETFNVNINNPIQQLIYSISERFPLFEKILNLLQ